MQDSQAESDDATASAHERDEHSDPDTDDKDKGAHDKDDDRGEKDD